MINTFWIQYSNIYNNNWEFIEHNFHDQLRITTMYIEELEFENVGFSREGKPEYPEKNLSEQRKNQQKLSLHVIQVRESNPGHIGGRRGLSPLCHPCSPLYLC